MRFILKVFPVIDIIFRHRLGRALELLGCTIFGGGQTVGRDKDGFSDISFEYNTNKKKKNIERYVLGFAFDIKKKTVLLIEKKRPFFLAGLYNGIGGRINEGETEVEAMRREGEEEAGILPSWIYGGYLNGINPEDKVFECFVFYAFDDCILEDLNPKLIDREKDFESLGTFPLEFLSSLPVVPDTRFLVEFGLGRDKFLFKGCSFITK